MSMKKLAGIYGMMAMISEGFNNGTTDNELVIKQDFGDGETAQRLRQGQKQYSNGVNTVWARSQKMATKKLNKLKEDERPE